MHLLFFLLFHPSACTRQMYSSVSSSPGLEKLLLGLDVNFRLVYSQSNRISLVLPHA